MGIKMTKRSNPETLKNLIPTTQRSKEEARELGRKGGQRSGEVRREKKMLRELAEEKLLEKMSNGKTMQDNLITKAASLAFSNKAKLSEVLKFFEIMRDTSGQKPVDKVAQTDTEGKDIPQIEILPVAVMNKSDENIN